MEDPQAPLSKRRSVRNLYRKLHAERLTSLQTIFLGDNQSASLLLQKCIKFGVKLVFVDPRYTSKTCHKCLHIHPLRDKSYRSGKSFRCGHCGWSGDADLNGAVNISTLGAVVNQPRGTGLACSLEQNVLGLLKTSTSA